MNSTPNAYPAQPEFSLSLCDDAAPPLTSYGIEQAARFVLSQSRAAGVERIYAGSYFCDRLFLALPDAHFDALAAFCAAFDVQATLVVPIFAQRTLQQGVQRTCELLARDLFDEVTVNDFATAERLAPACRLVGRRMNWGRLFAKQLRDPRHADFAEEPRTCEFDAEEAADLRKRYQLGLIELDPFVPVIDFSPLEGAPFALHVPHVFATTGHICEAASARRATEDSFRPNAPCACECARSFTLSLDEPSGAWYVKQGRTVYFENPECVATGAQPARIIYSAADFRSSAGAGESPAAATATSAGRRPQPPLENGSYANLSATSYAAGSNAMPWRGTSKGWEAPWE